MNYLHSHSDYSNAHGIRDCTIKVADGVQKAFEMGASAAVLTDHETLSGHVKHWNAVQKIRDAGEVLYNESPTLENLRMKNFKAVLGNEIYLSKEGQSGNTWQKGDRFYHLILLAKDRIGWSQLNELSTRAWNRMFKRAIVRTPTYLSDLKEIVSKNPGHLICSSACLGNYLGERILQFHRTRDEEIKKEILEYIFTMKELFGEDFYLEIQSGEGDQLIYNSWIKTFAVFTNTEIVVTTDNHYLNKEDRLIHDAFLNSEADLKGERETESFYKWTYFQTIDEIKTNLSLSTNFTMFDIEQAIRNTEVIVNKCEYYSIKSDISVPSIPYRQTNWEQNIHHFDEYPMFYKYSHSEHEIDRYFLYKIIKGFEEKRSKGILEGSEEELNRINIELHHIWEISEKINQRVGNYFNTMQEMLLKIWEVSIIGPGRGSAGAYLINFILDITQVNPLTTPIELPWWRFLHESRPELPDVDIDSAASKKEEIYNLLLDWFADMNKTISRVATFGTEKSKSALITAARGLGYEPEIGLFLSSLVPIDRGFPRKLEVCMNGDDDNKPVREFVQAMEEYPEVWQVALGIEGLINSLSQHAAAIVIIETDELFDRTSLMKSPNGGSITAYSLDDIDNMIGLVKYDMLVVNSLDAIQTTLYLLAEHGYIDWQNTLKATYDKYLHPAVLDYKTKEMWQLVHEHKILGLFQYDSPQGAQAIELIQPETLAELSAGNSAMRLMANEYHPELPLISYSKQKNNINLWYDDMRRYGLNQNEIEILEKHLSISYGVCIEQEAAMMLAMDPQISNFSMLEGNKLRKTIAKKRLDEVEKLKDLFYTKGKEQNTRQEMLDYVWNECFGLQFGYSFSVVHATLYSIIAIQQMNLNYYYPSIFWATARLMVESDAIDFIAEDLDLLSDELEDEEVEAREGKSVNYFKMSSAIGKVKSFGITVQPPDINESSFTFSPDVEENKIYFGLKGLSRIGNNLIYEIINNRPYSGLQDFLKKIKVNKIQATMLIKAGAFDAFGERETMLFQYCDLVADKKQRLTLQNVARLIELQLIPPSHQQYEILFKINKFLRKESRYDNILVITPGVKPYLDEMNYPHIEYDTDGTEYTQFILWEKFYKKEMENLKGWIQKNHDELLFKVNQAAINELLEKYAKGNRAYQEMEALSYYHSFHELETDEYANWLRDEVRVSNFFELPEEPIVEWENGQGAKKFRLYKIAGTAIGRDKTKHIVGFLTPEGFLTVKVYRATFNKYDKMIKENGYTDKSWFSKGSKLLLQGYRNGDTFILKAYKDTGQAIHQIVGPRMLKDKRLGE